MGLKKMKKMMRRIKLKRRINHLLKINPDHVRDVHARLSEVEIHGSGYLPLLKSPTKVVGFVCSGNAFRVITSNVFVFASNVNLWTNNDSYVYLVDTRSEERGGEDFTREPTPP
jgi:putative component of toxin-antitoxin plasmid stabilization module